MTILLPDSGRFREFESSLDDELVLGLADSLEAMGMSDAFDDERADFSGMDGQCCEARGDICFLISDVLHKAFVSVDEAGTEASAATAVIVGVTRAVEVGPEPIQVTVDRPFVFLIRDRTTGTLLFVGRMVEP